MQISFKGAELHLVIFFTKGLNDKVPLDLTTHPESGGFFYTKWEFLVYTVNQDETFWIFFIIPWGVKCL